MQDQANPSLNFSSFLLINSSFQFISEFFE